MLYLSRKKRNVVIIELKHTFKDEKKYCHYHTTLHVYKNVPLQQKDDRYREHFHKARELWSLITLTAYTHLMVLKEKIICI